MNAGPDAGRGLRTESHFETYGREANRALGLLDRHSSAHVVCEVERRLLRLLSTVLP